MENDLRGIGEVARRSGLTVSALRWYDENRVLVPAVVDPLTGYRWYAPDQIRQARVVARLRRVGMPVAAIRHVLADPAVARALLDAHLVRLEQGLADARRELSAALTLLTEETPVTPAVTNADATLLTASTAALAAALRAVRFAAAVDPADPALTGVLLDIRPEGGVEGATLAATDRYRLAVAPIEGARIDGPALRALLPAGWVDELVERLDAAPAGGEAELTLTAAEVAVRLPGGELTCERLDVDYPDYRRLVLDLSPGVGVQPEWLRDELTSVQGPGGPREHVRRQDDARRVVALIGRQGDDVVALREPADGAVAVDRDYLLEAVRAGGGGQVTLALDGPLDPLVIRTDAGLSLLMPIAPEA